MVTVIEAIMNIVLNYLFLFVFNFGIKGAAYSTVIAAFISLFVVSIHFSKSTNNLRIVPVRFDIAITKRILMIGFPSFLTQLGVIIFTICHNVIIELMASTEGVTAFSIVNYVHSVMLLMFSGIGTAIQPLISYFHGAKKMVLKKQTVKLAINVSLSIGVFVYLINLLLNKYIINIFGDFSEQIIALTSHGIKVFFIV